MSEDSSGLDPYDVVLADLYAKRDQIEQAIAAILAVRTGRSGEAANRPAGPTGPARPDEGPGALLGMSISDAAKKVLASKRTPLRNPDLVTAFKAGGLHLNSKDWTNTIGAVLTRRANEIGDIVRVERGVWGLKEWYPGRNFAKKDAKAENGDKGSEAVTDEVAPTSP